MKLFILSLALIGLNLVAAIPTTSTTFYTELYKEIAHDAAKKNIIFSPLSIRTCLGLTYLGAEGKTAKEIENAIHLSGTSKEAAAEEFSTLFSRSAQHFKLNIVNRVYVDDEYEVAPKFNELASKYFGATAEKLNFADSVQAADSINSWVEENTEHKIQNLFDKDSFNGDTTAVLANAIYFKARWKSCFGTRHTNKTQFSLDKTHQVPVDMMYQKDKFLYGKLEDLSATAVELKFFDSDLSMLVILPDEVDGLAALEQQLESVDVTKLSEKLSLRHVFLYLPKFEIEYEVPLVAYLKKLGMSSMFTGADFSSLLTTTKPMRISEAKHKAFIKISEMGAEAAAATYIKFVPYSGYSGPIYTFKADHPFYFAIKDANHVYFAGHVATF